MKKLLIKNEKETKEFGINLAKELKPSDVVALIGDLGTGKTTLSKYIAMGLGVEERITSPTFAIIHEYSSGRLPLYHFDVYRLSDYEEMYELGYEEYFFGEGVTIVEWADKVSPLIPRNAKTITITYGEKEGERIYNWSF